jgi:hypothetical protein
MINQLLRSFVRAYGRKTGYQAARATGWLIWPLLLIIVGGLIAAEMGMLPFDLPLPDWKSMLLNTGRYLPISPISRVLL